MTDRLEMRTVIGPAALVLLIAAIVCVLASPAQASTPIEEFVAGPSSTQAGGHPDTLFGFRLSNRLNQGKNTECNCEDAKDVTVHLPTGVVGDPHASPRCTQAELSTSTCPVDSQVGVVEIDVPLLGYMAMATYNMVPRPDEPGLLAFKTPVIGSPQYTVIGARTGSDYGLDAKVSSIVHSTPFSGARQLIWGVPADPRHDPMRYPFGIAEVPFSYLCDQNGFFSNDPAAITKVCEPSTSENLLTTPTPSNSPLKPFLQNPTTCGVPLTASLDVLSYDHGEEHATVPWPATTGCDLLSFNPSLIAQPTTSQTDSPSGIDVELTVPQLSSPSVPAPSEIRATTVTLPEGFSINPNAADGKTSCSDAEARFGTEEAARCPEFSKLGTISVESSILPGELPGYVYLGKPLPGNRYRLFLVADGFAVHVKLPGTVTADPLSGQIVASFKDLPQTPFQSFKLHFFGSERGVLATPTHCGTYPVISTFTPWDSALPDQSSTQFFTLDSGPNGKPCPGTNRPFAPQMEAGVQDNTAGAHTSFTLNLDRDDGDQNLSGLTVATPLGFSGVLKGIPYCPEAAINQLQSSTYTGLFEQATPVCPAQSLLGTATAGAGAGSHPLHAPGKVYLAGPYKGGPLSLLVVVPAVSGPYDLGNVAVRAAIYVDPTTARVTTVSDPFPQILEGIPLRTRSILVDINRPNFAINPTNCGPLATDATVSGAEGAIATPSAHFQVANCADLGFEPRLELKLKGGTKRGQNPALRATLTPRAGDANIAGATVILPHSVFLDNAHIKTLCTRIQFAADQCPSGSIYGYARATSPLIDQPLQGPVYLRSNGGERLLPDLVAKLQGQIDFEVVGFVDSVNQRLRSTFQTVPDVPVSKFTLSMQGGKKGLLENSRNLCLAPAYAKARFSGQNGKALTLNPPLQADCGAKARQKRRHLHSARKVG